MKFFVASILAVGALAAKDDPQAWESIAMAGAGKCSLKGTSYGSRNTIEKDSVGIASTVHGCEITDGSYVLTWVQIMNDALPGESEGFYCQTEYNGQAGIKSATLNEVDVETQSGVLDYACWSAVERRMWCKDSDTCMRQSVSQWRAYITDAPTNYPTRWDGTESSATCSAYRSMETDNNYMVLKFAPESYQVKTGFKIYASKADYDAGVV